MIVTKNNIPDFVFSHGIERPVQEHRFHKQRKWRFDFAWPEVKVALEFEGVLPSGKTRHQTINGYEKDCEKYNAAVMLGWRVIRLTQNMCRSGEWVFDIKKLLRDSGEAPRGAHVP